MVDLTQDATNTLIVTSTDIVLNVLTGSVLIVEDSTSPATVISTPTQTTYNPVITLTGTTEAFANVVVTGGSGTTGTVADAFGAWTLPVSLNLSSSNMLVATATDLAGNSGSASVGITHDSTPIFLTMNIPNQTVHTLTFTFTGTTKSGATVTIASLTGSLIFTAPASGDFTGTVNLVADTANMVSVTVQDATLATATGTFAITEDSTAPTLALSTPSGTTTALTRIVLQGTTETGAQISVNNSGTVTLGSATATGAFNLTIPLNANLLNTLDITATDAVGNVGTGTWTVVQDSIGPVISGLTISPALAGPQMIAIYSFATSENSTGTLSIGTGANIPATLVASGVTAGTTHSSLVPGLLANTNYYYAVTATDSAGNTTTSAVRIINSTDTVPPVIIDVTLSDLSTTGASLDFTFTEANFNTAYATGSITITTNTGIVIGTYPTSFSSGVISVGDTALSGLSSGTAYTYSISLTDTFGNTSTATGTFTTPASVALIGGKVTQTGAVSLGAVNAGTTAFSGTTITILSNPDDLDSLTGSLVLSGVTSIVSGTGWNGVLLSPVLVASNLPEAATAPELSALIAASSNTTATYSLGQILQTVKVGAEGVSITAVGGDFQVSFIVSGASIGQDLRIYRSTDGNTWQNSSPDASCLLDALKMCTFRTDHLSYFAVASIIGTPVAVVPPVISSGGGNGGGGGGSLSKDNCPSEDYSSSYYDGTCGVKPTVSVTSPITTGSGKQNVTFTSEIDSVIAINGTISREKLDRYVKDIQNRVYGRTLKNSERIMAFSSMNRYIDTQVKRIADSNKKAVLATIKNRFNGVILGLRQDIINGVTIIPNRKRNNAGSDIMANVVG